MSLAPSYQDRPSRMHPQKFAMWAACGSITMMFAALTSAYLVRKGAGDWLEFNLPVVFMYNTAVILISSVSLQASYHFFKKGNAKLYRSFLWLSLALGVLFMVLQQQGWMELRSLGVYMDINPSAGFFYVISGLHLAHVLGGIAALLSAIIFAHKLRYKVTEKRKNRFQMVLTYWHFLGFLWLYLFIFLLTQ